jgi:hypothetical protein
VIVVAKTIGVRVLSPLRVDGQRYEVGDTLTLAAKEARILAGLQIVEIDGGEQDDGTLEPVADTTKVPAMDAALLGDTGVVGADVGVG